MATPYTSRRLRGAALGLAVLAPLVLAGCDKPTPGVTAFAGSSSHRADAACWSQKSSSPVQESACDATATDVEVGAGDTVGISVDKDVADAGWKVQIGDGQQAQVVTPKTLKTTHFKLPVGSSLTQDFPLTVVAFDKSGQQVRGIWKFRLVPA
ncbi:hypothetical protein CLV35_3649 [Motilibacter peucedani]|uniref:DUF2771 domain-containing protein n=1 Tax=Motilibacter peucedani TaxID=598650 RepID=A0A420XK51_9ACTN|nr:hypothetical protein [Motilibacter peucedani]RKS68521.1 hypothetical protein CLV35_3649 [Motilibacter peucedani]